MFSLFLDHPYIVIAVDQWCPTFFGHGPLFYLLNPSGPKQMSRLSQVNACQNLWWWCASKTHGI